MRDAIQFVIAAFKSGQMLDLVATSLKIGFADAVNSLVNGFRIAVGFLWNALTDGSDVGEPRQALPRHRRASSTTRSSAGMETVINFLAAGMEWVGALLVKQTAQDPRHGQAARDSAPEDVNTDFGELYQSRKDGKLFGLDLDGMEQFGDKLTGEGASGLANGWRQRRRKAIEDAGAKGEFIDTSGMQEKLVGIIQTIREALPKPEDAQGRRRRSVAKASRAGRPVGRPARPPASPRSSPRSARSAAAATRPAPSTPSARTTG